MKSSGWLGAAVMLSVGFTVPFMYGHWLIICTRECAQVIPPLYYPGFLAVPLLVYLAVARRTSRISFGKAKDVAAAVVGAAISVSAVALPLQVVDPSIALAPLFLLAACVQAYMFVRWWGQLIRYSTKTILLSLLVGVIATSLLKILLSLVGEVYSFVAFLCPLAFLYALWHLPANDGTENPALFTGEALSTL